jgi:hypothetical protein
MSEVSGSDVDPSKQEKKPSLEGPAKPPLPKPKNEEYGFTFRNITMLAISGVFASSRAIRDGAKWYGSELRHHTKRTVIVTLLAATAIGVSVSLLLGPDDNQTKSAPSAEDTTSTTITNLDVEEPPFGWNIDDCQGASAYRVYPDVETLSEALMRQVPGMGSNEVLPIAENVASDSDIIGDNGNFMPDSGPIPIVGPAIC